MSRAEFARKTIFNLFLGMFIQVLIALAFDSGSLVSGTIVSFLMDIKNVKWILLIYGPLLAARGDIAILAGKLGTGLHIGSVKPTFRNNTPIYRSLILSVFTIAMFDAVLIGFVTYITNLIAFPSEVRILNPTLFFVIPALVLSIATLLSTQITSAVSFFTFKKGLNPDVYVAPVMSNINSILITLIYAGFLNILKPWGRTLEISATIGEFYPEASHFELIGTYICIIPAIVCIGFIIYIIFKNIREREYKKIMKEAIIAVFISVIIGTITGVTLSKSEVALETYPQLLIAFPALIATLVDQNSITANVLITDFSTGYIKPELKSIKKPKVWTTFLGVGAGGVVITILLTLIGSLIKIGEKGFPPVIVLLIIVTVLANILGYIIVGLLMFVLAIVAFRREIDPDNFAIPLTACLADLSCAGFILIFSILILGVQPGETETATELLRTFFQFSIY